MTPETLRTMFSSKTDLHSTPRDLFDRLDAEFDFVLDTCATDENTKCLTYFTADQDGLAQDWHAAVESMGTGAAWGNFPYGRGIGKWVQKAAETAALGTTVVCLLPARVDTRWFHSFVWDDVTHAPRPGVEVRFIRGRLKFGGLKAGAPFPSVVVVFRGAGVTSE